MNKVIFMGRLTRDPEIRMANNGQTDMAIAKFSLAVDRRFARNNGNGDQPTADFFNCTAFGKLAEFAEKYLKQGTKILLTGRIQNDNYTNKDGQKVYGTQVIVEDIEFAESKNAQQQGNAPYTPQQPPQGNNSYNNPMPSNNGFMNIPDGIEDDLPFH